MSACEAGTGPFLQHLFPNAVLNWSKLDHLPHCILPGHGFATIGVRAGRMIHGLLLDQRGEFFVQPVPATGSEAVTAVASAAGAEQLAPVGRRLSGTGLERSVSGLTLEEVEELESAEAVEWLRGFQVPTLPAK